MLRCTFLTLFILCYSTIAMESSDSKMTRIESVRSVLPFAGKIVAFWLNNEYYRNSQSYMSALNHTQLKYAYITEDVYIQDGDRCYAVAEIVKRATVGFWGIWNNVHIKSGLAIRLANDEELIDLYKTIKNKQDYFYGYGFSDQKEAEIFQVFEKQVGFELQMKKLS